MSLQKIGLQLQKLLQEKLKKNVFLKEGKGTFFPPIQFIQLLTKDAGSGSL